MDETLKKGTNPVIKGLGPKRLPQRHKHNVAPWPGKKLEMNTWKEDVTILDRKKSRTFKNILVMDWKYLLQKTENVCL